MSIQDEINAVQAQMAPLSKRLMELKGELQYTQSRDWIRVNNVTKKKVQLSTGDVPWFGHVSKFAEWLKKNRPNMQFAEWNGRIYFASELKEGRTAENTGLMRDLD